VDPLLGAVRLAVVRSLTGPLAGYLLHTTDLTGNPALAGLWRTALGCLAAVLVVPLAVAGVAVVTGRRRPHLERHHLLALGTALLALPATGLEVGLANRVVDAVLAPGAGPALWRRLGGVSTPVGDLVGTLAAVLSVLLLVVVAVLALARWATLWLLVGLAPLAMALALLPGGERLLGTWWRLQTGTVFLPIGQAAALATYTALFSSARHPLVGALAGVAVLALVARLPGWAAGLAVGVELRDVDARGAGRRLAGLVGIRPGGAWGAGAGSPAGVPSGPAEGGGW
jgi:hypothetical protein